MTPPAGCGRLCTGAGWALFRYCQTACTPARFDTELVRDPATTEYQVRQTERGADIAVVTDGLATRRRCET